MMEGEEGRRDSLPGRGPTHVEKGGEDAEKVEEEE